MGNHAAPSGPSLARPPFSPALAAVAAIVAAGCLATPVVLLAAIGPKYAEIFRDFGVQLPAHTRMLLGIGGSLWASPVLLLATLAGLFVVAGGVAWLSRRRPFALVLLVALCVVVAVLLTTLSIVSFMIPMVGMQQSLQQQQPAKP